MRAFGRKFVVSDSIGGAARRVVLAMPCSLVVAVAAYAQTSNSPVVAPPAEPPAAAESPPSDRPGFIDAVGRFFSGTQQAIGSGLKNTQDTLGNLGNQAAGAARDAAGTVSAMPSPRIVSGRETCPPSSNGAPDCQQGLETLCKGKGLRGGKVLEVGSGQRCSARAWAESGFKRKNFCRTETYVTRAVCH